MADESTPEPTTPIDPMEQQIIQQAIDHQAQMKAGRQGFLDRRAQAREDLINSTRSTPDVGNGGQVGSGGT